nr:MAG TPA: hypothetical protein [Caudoviricetes sp.]
MKFHSTNHMTYKNSCRFFSFTTLDNYGLM